jgi:hypothetical protein
MWSTSPQRPSDQKWSDFKNEVKASVLPLSLLLNITPQMTRTCALDPFTGIPEPSTVPLQHIIDVHAVATATIHARTLMRMLD